MLFSLFHKLPDDHYMLLAKKETMICIRRCCNMLDTWMTVDVEPIYTLYTLDPHSVFELAIYICIYHDICDMSPVVSFSSFLSPTTLDAFLSDSLLHFPANIS
jgi:hypothetical protein